MPFPLHRCLLPDGKLCADLDLYVRPRHGAVYTFSKRALILPPGSSASFDTYFGAFSLRKWQTYTSLRTLDLVLVLSGSVFVRIWGAGADGCHDLVLERHIVGEGAEQTIPISDAAEALPYESLYAEVVAEHPSVVSRVSFVSSQPKTREVGLAIVITTFNRFEDIESTARRLSDFLDEANQRGAWVRVCIVNNGDPIDVDEGPYLQVLTNPNLGGAGGFARGLATVREWQGCTHCLFMDDDAACEVTAIERAYAFLSYSGEESLSIAGSMLRKDRKYLQHEAGAAFHGLVRPLRHGLDLRDYETVLENEVPIRIDYGAWWFFLFPINKLKQYPFPFFVRGDDIEFSLSHDFRIVSLNGVATWQEDFAAKAGPMVTYLSCRSTLVTALLHGGWNRVLLWFVASAVKSSFAMCYDRTMSQCQAAADVLDGPAFWSEHADLAERRSSIKANTRYEQPVDEEARNFLDDFQFAAPERPWQRLLRFMTLNGHLLPYWAFRAPDTVSSEYRLSPFARAAFRHRRVLYKDGGRPIFIAQHDKRYFFSVTWRAMRLWFCLLIKGRRLAKEYRQAHGFLTSEGFWKKQFERRK